MKLKQNEKWPSLIIHNGRPYVLKKLERKGVNDPCSLCDLRNLCMGTRNPTMFYDLCTSDGRGDGWYYEEDWSIVGMQIADFVIDRLP